MVYVIAIGVALLAIAGIALAVSSGDRYATMSDKEFEAEAQRGSPVGSALLELQRIVSSGKNVEYMQQQDKREEGDSSESGDKP